MLRVPGLMETDKLLAKLAETRRGKMTFCKPPAGASAVDDVPAVEGCRNLS
jgi:hypothetical protein